MIVIVKKRVKLFWMFCNLLLLYEIWEVFLQIVFFRDNKFTSVKKKIFLNAYSFIYSGTE